MGAPDPLLLQMLRYKRPAFGPTEEIFIERFLLPIPGIEKDDYGNLWVSVGEDPNILWSCHTDTVHKTEGIQDLIINGPFVSANCGKKRKNSNCLGADDTTGVWLMVKMIEAQIPGLYIFHRDEEAGGKGSAFIAEYYDHQLVGIEFAIAFDRKGYNSVITKQHGRCCSDAFADTLIDALAPLDFKKDPTGVFTDTANYTDIIGECTNLSIGYFDQHGPKESQNWAFANRLLEVILAADFSGLLGFRNPGEKEVYVPYQGGYRGPYQGGQDYDAMANALGYGSTVTNNFIKDLDDFVYTFPLAVTKFLEDNGFTLEDLQEHRRRRLDGWLP